MHNVLSIILGGGRGTRLYPLTKMRAKPAVPLAGRYRLIDIPVSNCINSGIQKIYILTQFNSASLNRHIVKTYQFSPFMDGFVEILAAQQTPESTNWFQGTADAVRQYINRFKHMRVSDYLVLSGDHLYRMDYQKFVDHHRKTNADITISVVPEGEKNASEFGLLKIDDHGKVIEFKEKPTGDALKSMQVDTKVLGLDKETATQKPYIASMGIYVFKKEVLIKLLSENANQTDFGKEIIPSSLDELNVQAYLFNDYWEDIGTIEAFYKANLDLLEHPNPRFSFYDADKQIFSRPRFLPPNKILDSHIDNSMICDGCIINQAIVKGSIIGIRSRIRPNSIIEDSLIMGADFYQTHDEIESDRNSDIPPVGIGPNTIIKKAIIDKNARIGKNVKIINEKDIAEETNEESGYYINSGIVIVTKGAVIRDNTVI